MDAILNINSNAAAFADASLTNNPRRRYFDWTRNVNGLAVRNPKATTLTVIPGENKLVFDGTRTLTTDGTTAWGSKSIGDGVYRFTWSGGTAPGMRTQRALNFVAQNISVSVNNNSTVTVTGTGLFGNVQAGDNLYISLPTDPTPSPLSPANGGFWVVLSTSSNAITLARPTGQSFNAAGETVSVTNTVNGPILAYSNAGVQVGDRVDISAGFQTAARKTYTVNAITSNWFEAVSVSPLPEETGITPGAAGLIIYSSAKSFLRVEADQEASVYMNGITADLLRVCPVVADDPNSMGWIEIYGPVWSLSVLNRSAYPLNLNVFSAE